MPKFTASLNLPKYSSAPSTPTDGDVYYNTSDHKVYSRINGAWVDLGATSAPGAGIPETIIDAKGDLIVGSAADTAMRLAVGTNGQIVSANSAVTGGIEWIDNVAEETRLLVKNETGSTLTKGQVVYINGASGNLPTVTLAQANSEATSSKTVGVVRQTIVNNESGYVTLSGLLKNVDTQGFTAGQAIWLSAATAGAFTGTRPSAPDHGVLIGYIPKVSVNGEIFVMIQNGFELQELHNVLITSPAANEYLKYDGTKWVNANTFPDPKITGVATIDNNAATPISIDSSEGTQLHAVNQDSLITRTVLDAHGTDVYGAYSTRRSRGTAASPTAVQSGDNLGELSVRGYGETSFPNVSSGRILFSATENHTDTNRGTKAVIQVTPNGGSSTDDALIVTPSGVDLPLGSSYKINNTSVLSGSTLESSVVNSSLTSVGTISTGTWNGTVIGISYGGTGHDTAAEAINALLPVQTSHNGKFLTTNGTDPSWAALDNITLDGGGA